MPYAPPPFTLENVKADIRSRIQDPQQKNNFIGEPDLDSVVRSAMSRIDNDMPANVIDEFAGTNSQYYPLLASLPQWVEGWSSIRWIQSPGANIALGEVPIVNVPRLEWRLTEGNVVGVRTIYIYFVNAPSSTQIVRVAYTIPHHLSGLDGATTTTILPHYAQAFADLCASYALQIIANQSALLGQPTMQADIVNYQSLTRELRNNAKIYEQRYMEAIAPQFEAGGVAGEETPQFLDWSSRQYWLFHNRTQRLPMNP